MIMNKKNIIAVKQGAHGHYRRLTDVAPKQLS